MSFNWDKLIVALDLEDKNEIERVVDELSPKGVKFKVGLIAYTKFGPEFVQKFIDAGVDVFLDLKLHDIPNTMKRAAAVITEMKCWAFTVHTQAGEDALGAVVDEVDETVAKLGVRKPLILGVTVLTSSPILTGERQQLLEALVERADTCGLSGVICSPLEAATIKGDYPKLKVITPGIRNEEDSANDQIRVATASAAFENGADYIVVGRPILSKQNYLQAAEAILKG